jgi:hypothetical protein
MRNEFSTISSLELAAVTGGKNIDTGYVDPSSKKSMRLKCDDKKKVAACSAEPFAIQPASKKK